jgi:hypothetical protein
MAWYVECASNWSEMWTCDSFARLCESPIVRRYLLAPEVRSQKLADFRLMDAMMDHTGAGIRPSIATRLKEQHGRCDIIDLLNPRYRAFTFRDRGGYALAAERAYVRATALTSTFALIRAERGLVRLRITCRAPANADVIVRVNGERAGAVRVGTQWQTSCIGVPAREGVNWLELQWPPAAPASDELERAARRLERGLYPDVLPCYGEIHALTATHM